MTDNKTGSNLMVLGSLIGSMSLIALILSLIIYVYQQDRSGHPCVYDPSLTLYLDKGM